jgi:hypothetical protein
MGKWRYISTILDLRTRWRWVVIFTPRPIYARGNSPWYPFYGLDGPPNQAESCKVEKYTYLATVGNQTLPDQPGARPYTDSAVAAQYPNISSTYFFQLKYNSCAVARLVKFAALYKYRDVPTDGGTRRWQHSDWLEMLPLSLFKLYLFSSSFVYYVSKVYLGSVNTTIDSLNAWPTIRLRLGPLTERTGGTMEKERFS